MSRSGYALLAALILGFGSLLSWVGRPTIGMVSVGSAAAAMGLLALIFLFQGQRDEASALSWVAFFLGFIYFALRVGGVEL